MLYFYFFLLLIWHAGASYRFDYKYSRLAKGWLKLHRVPATFNDAFFQCDQEGAVLASPSDEGLLEALKEKISKRGQSRQIYTGLYVGIHATISRGDYTTIDGIPLDRIPMEWAENEPQDYCVEEGCLVMLDNGSLGGVGCNESYPYVCYKKKTRNMIMNECGTLDAEYTLDKRTGSCYKYHRNGLTWRSAYSTCLAEGSYLAIVSGDDELKVMKSIFENNPTNRITGSKHLQETAVGVLDWGKTGKWYTVHGQKIKDTGFNVWGVSQPDNDMHNDPTGEHCVSLNRNMVYNDIPCDYLTFAYVCEKDPSSLMSDDDLEQVY